MRQSLASGTPAVATAETTPTPESRSLVSTSDGSVRNPVPCGPMAALAELHADSLLHQLQATSTEDLLRMLDEEEGLGGTQLG